MGAALNRIVFQPPEFSSYADALNLVPLQTRTGNLTRAFHSFRGHEKLTIIFSHNNAEDLGHIVKYLMDVSQLWDVNIFAYEYTGYGLSKGTPSEENVYADAEAAYEYLTTKFGTPPAKIVVYGRSIGSGPSLHLATKYPGIRGLILQSALMSVYRVPMRGLRVTLPGDMFCNIDKIRRVQCPVFIIHGQCDEIVDFTHALELYNAVPNGFRVTPYFLEDAGHNNVEALGKAEFIENVGRFLTYLKKYYQVSSHKLAPPLRLTDAAEAQSRRALLLVRRAAEPRRGTAGSGAPAAAPAAAPPSALRAARGPLTARTAAGSHRATAPAAPGSALPPQRNPRRRRGGLCGDDFDACCCSQEGRGAGETPPATRRLQSLLAGPIDEADGAAALLFGHASGSGQRRRGTGGGAGAARGCAAGGGESASFERAGSGGFGAGGFSASSAGGSAGGPQRCFAPQRVPPPLRTAGNSRSPPPPPPPPAVAPAVAPARLPATARRRAENAAVPAAEGGHGRRSPAVRRAVGPVAAAAPPAAAPPAAAATAKAPASPTASAWSSSEGRFSLGQVSTSPSTAHWGPAATAAAGAAQPLGCCTGFGTGLKIKRYLPPPPTVRLAAPPPAPARAFARVVDCEA